LRHIERETCPCSRLTPFATREHARAMRFDRIAERVEPGPWNAHGFDGRTEIPLDQLAREVVVARLDRRVRGEDDVLGDRREGCVEVVGPDQRVAESFEDREGGMTFVQVECVDFVPQGGQCPHPAHAEDELLLQAMLEIAAVQPVGDVTVVRAVRENVRVQQIERDGSDIGAPDAGEHGPTRKPDLNHERRAVGQQLFVQWRRQRFEVAVRLPLPAVGIDALREITFAIEQTDGGERNAEVARRLEVVTGKDTETAREDAKTIGNRELGGEVGRLARFAVAASGQVRIQRRCLENDLTHEFRIGGRLGQAGRRQLLQQPDRVAVRTDPGVGIEPAEQGRGLSAPAPTQVVR
jgi:hypothetical protein